MAETSPSIASPIRLRSSCHDRQVGRPAAPDDRDRALCANPGRRSLSNQSLMDQLKHLIEVWTSFAQGLTGRIGALAFVCAFIWTMVAVAKDSEIDRAVASAFLTR